MNGFDARINELKNGGITERWAAKKILKLQADIDNLKNYVESYSTLKVKDWPNFNEDR